MISDIYTRDVNSYKYDPNRLEINDSLSLLIVKIENTLFTNRSEVLGVSDFGANLNELIFSLVLNESTIKRRIEQQIQSYCLPNTNEFTVDVQVSFFNTIERNGALIDIYVNERRVIGILF